MPHQNTSKLHHIPSSYAFPVPVLAQQLTQTLPFHDQSHGTLNFMRATLTTRWQHPLICNMSLTKFQGCCVLGGDERPPDSSEPSLDSADDSPLSEPEYVCKTSW